MKVSRIEEQKRTVSHILNKYKYGDIIPDAILSKLLGYNIKYTKQYNRYIGMMSRIRHQLFGYGVVIKRISNGYYILKPAQVSRYCYRKNITHAHNIIKCGINTLINVDETALDSMQKEELENLKDLSFKLDNEMEYIIKSSQYYSRKDYYDSLISLDTESAR